MSKETLYIARMQRLEPGASEWAPSQRPLVFKTAEACAAQVRERLNYARNGSLHPLVQNDRTGTQYRFEIRTVTVESTEYVD